MAHLYDDNPHRSPDPGYLGSTSFSATFFENKNFDLGPEADEISSAHGETRRNDWLSHAERSGRVQRGAGILAMIEQVMPYEPLIEKWNEQCVGEMLSMWITPCIASIKMHIYKPLTNKRGLERENFLLECSRSIFLESWETFELRDSASMSEFAESFTGSHIRWETIGFLFTSFALASVYYKFPGVYLARIERPKLEPGFERRAMEASYMCLSFCEEAGHLTDPELWLQCQTFYLCSIIEGDAGLVTWKRLGDLISSVIAKGLHTEVTVSAKVPFWLAERKKMIFASVYGQDKTISALIGRPPRLARRYCHMQLPLDLAPEDLHLPQQVLEERVNALDDNGWGSQHNVTSLYRTSLISHMLKEDILDVALTTIPMENTSGLLDLQQRVAYAWKSLPNHVTELPSDLNQGLNYLLRSCQIDFVYNQFLLQRVIVRKLENNTTETDALFNLSRTLLAAVLDLASSLNRADYNGTNLRVGKHAADLPWLLMKNGLPTAGVLGLELLRRFEGESTSKSNTTSPMCPPSASAFSTSEAIQQLSVLASTLGWAVARDHGNFQLLDQARRVVLRILERVLNPAPKPNQKKSEPLANETKISWWEEQTVPTMSEVDFWTNLPKHPLLK